MNHYVFLNPISQESGDFLFHSFQKIGISLSSTQVQQFLIFYDMLVEKNKVMNLTAITSFEEVVLKHFVDSVLFVQCEQISAVFSQGHSLLDVGSGAGFPGIPLKIIFPDLQIVLLDSLNKRVQFLDEVIDKLELDGISAIHFRAEDAAHDPSYRHSFDLCVSRAVANLSSLAEYCLPFVKQNGYFISYKSAKVEEEVLQSKKACYLLGGELVSVNKTSLPNPLDIGSGAAFDANSSPEAEIGRSFVLIKKIRNSSSEYPRKAGIPSKKPLG